ncbi:hypothetical protein BJX64DRAFT_260174 [Aspergillus heterothallicus]
MSRLAWFVLFYLRAQTTATARATSTVVKRDVLSDLSGGFCRSWKFGGTLGFPSPSP